VFTGIIQALGSLQSQQPIDGDLRLQIGTGKLDISDLALGDSVAVNGVCLTVVSLAANSFSADVSNETRSLTSLGQIRIGSPLNLEKAATLQTRLSGHWVSGHVDGLGTILNRTDDARSVRFDLRAPKILAHYIAPKGSITVDGVSLTVNAVTGAHFTLNIVPHTLQETCFSEYRVGDQVNLEVDMLARYVERLMLKGRS
jgi:riboflavin synthase